MSGKVTCGIIVAMALVAVVAIWVASSGDAGWLKTFENLDKVLAPIHKFATIAAALVAIGAARVAVKKWRAEIQRATG